MNDLRYPGNELHPAAAVPTPRRKTLGDYVALAIATCGVGYAPIAPGTMGSLVGVGVYLLLRHETIKVYVQYDSDFSRTFTLYGASILLIPILLLVIVALSLVGIWAASRAERLFGRKDPGAVVIDEVVGQLITFVFVLPYFLDPVGIVIGFILFRAFDIIKPYPIRKLEKLAAGLGIVVDDIAAGLYAGVALSVISMLRLHVLPWPW
jgi:phosphatidylglycerophosphatase A